MPNFSDRYLAGLKLEPGQKDRLLFDEDCRGLGVRLSALGTRTFLVQWTDRATGDRPPLKWSALRYGF